MRINRILPTLAVLVLATMNEAMLGQEARTVQSAGEIHEYEQVVQASERSNGGAWWKLAMLYQDAARFRDAERAYGKALELLQSDDPLVLANVMDCMGTLYVQIGRLAEGEQLERKALAIRQEQRDQIGIGLSWMHLAMLSLGQHDNAGGEMYAELAVERLVLEKGEISATGEQKMTALTYLALARCAAHECKNAMAPLKHAMTIAEASYPEKGFPISYVRYLEGYVDWKRGDDRTAASLMKNGTEGMEAQLGWGHPTLISAMRQYEGFLETTRRNVEAAEVREKLARFAGSQSAARASSAAVLPQ